MSDLKITLNGKPIGEAMNERVEMTFYEQVFKVEKSITESTDDFILTTIAGSEINERRLPKERVRRALWLLAEEEEGRLVYTGHPHEDAIETLTKSGWLRDHDREIYEQGRTDTIQVMRCREISRALEIANKEMEEGD